MPEPSKRPGRPLVVACAFFVALSATAFLVAGSPDGTRGARLILLYLAMTLAMTAAWWLAQRVGVDGVRWVLGAGIAARLILVPVEPFSTHDVDRYLWDGRVVLEGLDPYRTPADAPAIQDLRQDWPVAEEHAAYPTLYPPGGLALFAGCAAFGPKAGPWVYKSLVAIASILLLLVASAWLREQDLAHHLPLVALSPLLVLEGGIGAHVDIVAALGLALGLWLWTRRRHGWAGIALAAGALVKLVPIVAAATLAAASTRRRGALLVASTTATLAAGYGVAMAIGLVPVGSLADLFAHWRFGSPIGAAIADLPEGWPLVTTWVLGMLGLLLALSWARRAVMPATLLVLSLPLLLSPVVFPWYLAGLVVVLAANPSWFVVAWLCAVPLTYEVIDLFDASGLWQPAVWPLVLLVVAWIAGLTADIWLAGRRPTQPVAPVPPEIGVE